MSSFVPADHGNPFGSVQIPKIRVRKFKFSGVYRFQTRPDLIEQSGGLFHSGKRFGQRKSAGRDDPFGSLQLSRPPVGQTSRFFQKFAEKFARPSPATFSSADFCSSLKQIVAIPFSTIEICSTISPIVQLVSCGRKLTCSSVSPETTDFNFWRIFVLAS
jgi:hypothetical protein